VSRVGNGGVAVEVTQLVKSFRRERRGRPWKRREQSSQPKRAVDSVDLLVKDGEMVAIVGLNDIASRPRNADDPRRRHGARVRA
jgi:ABC-type glutathione transport system ATPase component